MKSQKKIWDKKEHVKNVFINKYIPPVFFLRQKLNYLIFSVKLLTGEQL